MVVTNKSFLRGTLLFWGINQNSVICFFSYKFSIALNETVYTLYPYPQYKKARMDFSILVRFLT